MKELTIINNKNIMEALQMVMFGVAVNVVNAYFEAVQDGMNGILTLLNNEYPMVEAFYKNKEKEKANLENKEVENMLIEETKKDIKKLETKPELYTTSRDLKELKELKTYLEEMTA